MNESDNNDCYIASSEIQRTSLPVTLVAFAATFNRKQKTVISWQVEQEYVINYYAIEFAYSDL